MNKYLIFGAAVAALTAVSCSEENLIQPDEKKVELTVNVCMPEDVQTKAVTSYTYVQPYESAVKRVQVLVFDDTGTLNAYDDGTDTSVNLKVSAGEKRVFAIVNGPDLSTIKDQAELEAFAVDLSDNTVEESKGFVMSGSDTCTVSGTSIDCAITVSRLVSRVALMGVTNDLPASYGDLQIERVWISNVVGNQNLSGTAEANKWYNQEGRADEAKRVKEHIIDGNQYKASVAALTYHSVNQTVTKSNPYSPSTPDLFYAYPNSSGTAPDGFKEPFAAQRTVLVVAATVNGKLYYYPVVLDKGGLERNTTYTVGLTIKGLGSDDPNKPVTKGGLNVNITVDKWESGAVYEEEI